MKGILPIIQLVLLVLKITGTAPVVAWSWPAVFIPFWIMLASFIVVAIWFVFFTKGTRP